MEIRARHDALRHGRGAQRERLRRLHRVPDPGVVPLYRIVQVQIERDGTAATALPAALLRGRVLSAVYRISSASMSKRQGIALRLMIDPRTLAASEPARATPRGCLTSV